MYPRFYKPPISKSFFLLGPRATGKTTWIKQQFPTAQYLDLLDAEIARTLLANPTRLEGMIRKKTAPWIVLDEVQKVPAVLDEVHRLIENKKWKFILTGSSARKLRRGQSNLLAGRALQKFFYPLTAWELGSDFSLKHALQWGMLPNAWVDTDIKDFLSAYVYVYLKEEVFAEGLTRNLEVFTRFLEIMSFSQAQPTNLASIARDIGIDAKVVANYLEILEDLLLAACVPVFTKRAKRRMMTHPKFFLFDCGIHRILRPRGPLDDDRELDGSALETLFFHHHRALGEFCQWDQQLFYWRTSQKIEVDFISYGPLGLFAFEVKRSSIVRNDDLRGLHEFKKDYPMAKCFLFYGGEREQRIDDIEIINVEKGLKDLPTFFGVNLPAQTVVT